MVEILAGGCTLQVEVVWYPIFREPNVWTVSDMVQLCGPVQKVEHGVHLFLQNAASPGAFLATLDLKDAYLHVPIRPQSRQLLRFAVRGPRGIVHFQFVALPFGLSSAPRIFTKILAEALGPLKEKGVPVVPYPDDLLFYGPSQEHVCTNLKVVVDLSDNLG